MNSIMMKVLTIQLPSPTASTLHAQFADLTSPDKVLKVLQKLIHSYPTYQWCQTHPRQWLNASLVR